MIFNFCHVSLSVSKRGRPSTREKQRMRVTHKRHFNAKLCRRGQGRDEVYEEKFELQFTKAAQNRTMMRGINSSLIVVRVSALLLLGGSWSSLEVNEHTLFGFVRFRCLPARLLRPWP